MLTKTFRSLIIQMHFVITGLVYPEQVNVEEQTYCQKGRFSMYIFMPS